MLTGAIFDGADMREIIGLDVVKAAFSAKLQGASIGSADWSGLNLEGADLTGVNLRGANLQKE